MVITYPFGEAFLNPSRKFFTSAFFSDSHQSIDKPSAFSKGVGNSLQNKKSFSKEAQGWDTEHGADWLLWTGHSQHETWPCGSASTESLLQPVPWSTEQRQAGSPHLGPALSVKDAKLRECRVLCEGTKCYFSLTAAGWKRKIFSIGFAALSSM